MTNSKMFVFRREESVMGSGKGVIWFSDVTSAEGVELLASVDPVFDELAPCWLGVLTSTEPCVPAVLEASVVTTLGSVIDTAVVASGVVVSYDFDGVSVLPLPAIPELVARVDLAVVSDESVIELTEVIPDPSVIDGVVLNESAELADLVVLA